MEEKEKKNTKKVVKKTTTKSKTSTKKTTNKKPVTKSTSTKLKTEKKTAAKKPSAKKASTKTPIIKEVENKDTVKEVVKENKASTKPELVKIVADNKEGVKNQKLVILFASLIIALLIFGVIYITGKNHQDEKKLADFINNVNKEEKPSNNETTKDDEERLPATVDYDNIKDVKYNEINTLFKEQEKVIVLVTSKRCNACQRFQPTLSSYLKENKKIAYRVETTKMNREELRTFGKTYGLESTPTLLVISKNGDYEKIDGLLNKNDLDEWIKENY